MSDRVKIGGSPRRTLLPMKRGDVAFCDIEGMEEERSECGAGLEFDIIVESHVPQAGDYARLT